jgi:Arm DNA-binding domain/Phage integrase central domain
MAGALCHGPNLGAHSGRCSEPWTSRRGAPDNAGALLQDIPFPTPQRLLPRDSHRPSSCLQVVEWRPSPNITVVISNAKTGRLVIHDVKTPLILRLSSTGIASWSVSVHTKGGKRSQPLLGRWPAMGVSAARKRAMAVLSEIHAGGDPVSERRAMRADREARAALPTVAARLEDWQTAKASQWSARYQSEVRRLCHREIAPKLGKRPLAEVSRADWSAMISTVHRRAPAVGAMLYRTAASFLAHCEAVGWLPVSTATP